MELTFKTEIRQELVELRPDSVDMLDAIERRLAELYEYYLEPDVLPILGKDDPLSLQVVREYMVHAQRSIGRRLGTLLEDFVHLANARRPYALAMVARAVLETTAKLTTFRDEIGEALAAGVAPEDIKGQVLDRIDQVNLGSRFDWTTYLKSKQETHSAFEKMAKPDNPPAVGVRNVVTLVGKLEKRHARLCEEPGRVLFLYSMLSDIVHPALGGEVLVIGPFPGRADHVLFAAQPRRDAVRSFLVDAALPAVEISCRHMLALNSLRELIAQFP